MVRVSGGAYDKETGRGAKGRTRGKYLWLVAWLWGQKVRDGGAAPAWGMMQLVSCEVEHVTPDAWIEFVQQPAAPPGRVSQSVPPHSPHDAGQPVAREGGPNESVQRASHAPREASSWTSCAPAPAH